MRNNLFELPRGRIENGETKKAAAIREFREETGLDIKLIVKSAIGELNYQFIMSGEKAHKRVSYFLFETDRPGHVDLASLSKDKGKIHWLSRDNVDQVKWVSNELRIPVVKVFEKSVAFTVGLLVFMA